MGSLDGRRCEQALPQATLRQYSSLLPQGMIAWAFLGDLSWTDADALGLGLLEIFRVPAKCSGLSNMGTVSAVQGNMLSPHGRPSSCKALAGLHASLQHSMDSSGEHRRGQAAQRQQEMSRGRACEWALTRNIGLP